MRDLSVAVIGCGRIGAHTPASVRDDLPPGWWPLNHAAGVKSVEGLKLVACCDIDQKSATATASKYDAEPFVDFRAMLEKHRPDIVTIATRAEGRGALIGELARSGVRGIHAEKPLCRNLRDGQAAAAAVHRHNVVFSYGATRRYMAAYRTAKARIDSGEFGTARQVHVHLGAGALQWTHPHSVDIAMFFAGDGMPEKAQAAFLEPLEFNGNMLDADPRLAFGFLKFANGFSALISAAPGCDIAVGCDLGTVAVLADGASIGCRKIVARSGQRYFRQAETVQVHAGPSGLQTALGELRDAINGGSQPSSGIAQALAGQRALFALALSALQGGREVRLSDVPVGFTVTGRTGDLYA